MNRKLEVAVVPVSDVDRAKRFYETLGATSPPLIETCAGDAPVFTDVVEERRVPLLNKGLSKSGGGQPLLFFT